MTADEIGDRIDGSIGAPDDDLSPPARSRQGSFSASLATLEVGETATKAINVAEQYGSGPQWEVTLSTYAENAVEWRAALGNNVKSSIRAVRTRTGRTFSVEVVDVLTPSGRLFLMALVTRIT